MVRSDQIIKILRLENLYLVKGIGLLSLFKLCSVIRKKIV